jgi:hypothetical protein
VAASFSKRTLSKKLISSVFKCCRQINIDIPVLQTSLCMKNCILSSVLVYIPLDCFGIIHQIKIVNFPCVQLSTLILTV